MSERAPAYHEDSGQRVHDFLKMTLTFNVIIGQYEFPVLLGRAGFFDKFVIAFDQANEKVTLKANTKRY